MQLRLHSVHLNSFLININCNELLVYEIMIFCHNFPSYETIKT